ncbi:hypothetical protein PR048_028280 [Dryococelus australis]|uniref:Uncharacterized protein n=1 Tax=Dryococelus australis TaxID=614101 RepID=A0ABQ9GIV7_9NEOP|nr:hypothetical protein PR048_028280 [Dryococelus australis]
MKNKYEDDLELDFTDTDSYIYEIKTNNLYEDMSSDPNFMSARHQCTSTYPSSHMSAILPPTIRLLENLKMSVLGRKSAHLYGCVQNVHLQLWGQD